MIDMVGTALQAFYLFHIVPFVVLMFFPVFFLKIIYASGVALCGNLLRRKAAMVHGNWLTTCFFFRKKKFLFQSLAMTFAFQHIGQHMYSFIYF
jgi:hypothetical protein